MSPNFYKYLGSGGGGGAAAAATGAAAKYVPGSGPVEAELVKRQLQLRQNWWADNAADADADADGSGLPTSVARGGGGGDADGSSKGEYESDLRNHHNSAR